MPTQYGSEANERWLGFEHRPGDVVVSTRSKCGTTWAQMICALLVHGTPELPAPLSVLSPWLDWDVEPVDVVRHRLDAQAHRRVIKTHTPLDGLPLDDRVTYVVVGRHPLDVAVSLLHHARNIDRDRFAELSGRRTAAPEVGSEREWIDRWIDDPTDPRDQLDTLAGNLHHLADARSRAAGTDVVLVRYEDLEADLDGGMRALARRLGVEVDEARWPALVEAASFDAMRRDPAATVPDRLGVLRDQQRFFRTGRSGEGVAACTDEQLTRYHRRAGELADAELLAWLHAPVAAEAVRR
ncbi:sulfotransferase domain-containing protein [Dermatobacter hominis]|uniref:sulfotransferase domain-containing protein n=1 Tax=Dermatobacter hominis TaxID=2884263 RepID=UPI001D106834|nr:sulfotransferase domain-containing protein [Dermatobacter hominis]UDY35270.1 sulfotransferase domain-containing protein [Dermatobacter hominis]